MNEKLVQGTVFNFDFSVDTSKYLKFVELSNDRNPLHMDSDFAVNKGFDGPVMHGNQLNVFISYFIGELLGVENVMLLTQTIKYQSPFYLHDKLKFHARVSEVFESVQVINFKFQFKEEDKNIAKGEIQIKLI